jgi:hypothetical protein
VRFRRPAAVAAVTLAAAVGWAGVVAEPAAAAPLIGGVVQNVDRTESFRVRDVRKGPDEWLRMYPGWFTNVTKVDVDYAYAPCSAGRIMLSVPFRRDVNLGNRTPLIRNGSYSRLYVKGC